jgi:hypothetical protein
MLSHPTSRRRIIDGDEGIDFVRCRICGDYLRVISGRHLSKHDTDLAPAPKIGFSITSCANGE